MANPRATQALIDFKREQSRAKKRQVMESIERLAGGDEVLTIAAVARGADVSREFIHSHPQLVTAVKDAARRQRTPGAGQADPTTQARTQGLLAERATLLATVAKQRDQIASQKVEVAEFSKQRQRWLGAQLQPHVDPVDHASLQISHDRLVSQAVLANRQLDELRRQVTELNSDLAAARAAHEETIAERSATGSQITFISEHRS